MNDDYMVTMNFNCFPFPELNKSKRERRTILIYVFPGRFLANLKSINEKLI